jgi:hypothetical protein
MSPEQVFALLMLIVGALAVAITVGSVRSYWRQMRTGPRVTSADVGSSWFRPLVRN